MISLQVFGVEATAEYLKDGIRLFKAEQRKKMRQAAVLVRRDVISKVKTTFKARTKPRFFTSGKPRGPLSKSIGYRLVNTTASVEAFIRPKAQAFYGRLHETGLNTERKGRNTGKYFTRRPGGRKFVTRSASKPFRLDRRPFLEPVANADQAKVVAIMGESFGVFYRGGA